MKHLIEHVRRYAARHRLWKHESRVVAAVSGGSDSVAMLFLLRELADRGEIVLAGLAHLNHHIRGAESDGDAVFCRTLAERVGVPAIVSDADVPENAKEHGVSIEVAARHARQQFYRDALKSVGADVITVAHTRDDQAETVLLRLTRGAGGGGLGAMQPRRDHIVRPLLDCSREELQQFLRDCGEAWREDATNADRSIARNRIRHEVMPALRGINAQADAAMARAAEILRGDEEFLERLANAAFLKCVEVKDKGARGAQGARGARGARGAHGADGDIVVRVDRAEFEKLPIALARRVARYALETANPGRTYDLREVDEAVERFRAGDVLLNRVPKVPGVPDVPTVSSVEFQLEIPGTVESPRGAWVLSAEGPIATPRSIGTDPRQVMVDAHAVGAHLIVRYRRPGDRLQPLGAPGRKKVQDVLVDRKVPRDDRDAVPIVTTEKGEIVWIAGEVLADPFRVTPLTKSVVVLTLRR